MQEVATVDDNEFVPEMEMQDVSVMGENGEEPQTKVQANLKAPTAYYTIIYVFSQASSYCNLIFLCLGGYAQ